VSAFVLNDKLASESSLVCDLTLSRILLSKNSLFPWLILVPMQNGLREIVDLSETDRGLLIEEISLLSKVMQEIFKPEKLNIASFGNIVPQLHIHIIARHSNDSAWPESVFGKGFVGRDVGRHEELLSSLRDAMMMHSSFKK